jgi:hypothetical protein
MADHLAADDIRDMWQDAFQLAEGEWRRATLEVLKAALVAFDDDPRAPIAVPRLLAAARLAVS